MRRPRLLALAGLLLAPPAIVAQQGPPLDTSFLKRYAETRGFLLGRPQKPKFTPDGKTVLFLRAAGPTTPRLSLFAFDVATGQSRELLSPDRLLGGAAEVLSDEEKARRERQRVSTGGVADYHLDPSDGTGRRLLIPLAGRLHLFDWGSGAASELATGPGPLLDPKWSPDGKTVSYVRDHDIRLYDLASKAERPFTTGGTALKPNGVAEFVAQEEMGRSSGYWWSPDSKRIAYAAVDNTGVEEWRVVDPLKPGAVPPAQYYPRPGKKNASVRLGVKEVAGGETAWVGWDRAKWEYLAAVKWDEQGPLTVQLQDRKQQELTLLRVNPNTGGATRLLTDADPAWVNIPKGVPKWTGPGEFYWTAERPDRASLMRYSRNGELSVGIQFVERGDLELLAAGPDGVALLLRADKPDAVVSYAPTPVAAPGAGRAGPLGAARGVNSAVFSRDLSLAAVTASDFGHLPTTSIVRVATGDVVGTLPSVAAEPPIRPNVVVGPQHAFAGRHNTYWAAVVRPHDFDPAKKYPVIVDVYGGPHHLHVQPAMRNWLVPQWLANQGFIVVAIDNRGTPGRGRDWERDIYQKFGTVPLDDQIAVLQRLPHHAPQLDLARVGVVGWSFGGYMAANAVLRRPDIFHAAVAGAPVTDWEDYDSHYTERYLGTLPASRAAYDEASLIPLAKNLNRPLLLVHGTADDNVYYRHSLKLADALFRAGRDFDMLPLPGVTHMASADPVVMERLWERTARFLRAKLGEVR